MNPSLPPARSDTASPRAASPRTASRLFVLFGLALAASAVAAVAMWCRVRWRHAAGTVAAPVRRQVGRDILMGVARRARFVARWGTLLEREDGPAAGSLLVVRLADLTGLNRHLGRGDTDRALGVIAQVLHAYPARVPGCLVGRLNGADFALVLPATGLAAETAASIASALRAALGPFGRQVHVHVGAVEFVRGTPLGALLGRVDQALAIAEGRGPFGVEVAAGVDAIGGRRAPGQAR